MLCVLIVEGMSIVVNVMLSLMSVMSPPPALCNLSVRIAVKLCKKRVSQTYYKSWKELVIFNAVILEIDLLLKLFLGVILECVFCIYYDLFHKVELTVLL